MKPAFKQGTENMLEQQMTPEIWVIASRNHRMKEAWGPFKSNASLNI